ncbi:putative thiazole-containing bacteriocin maturation protein [Alteribacillus sp. JSM 102045]|uniref:putative thiazole-containing bacteriocin maturation protein n=1 Tax=Alteribacillus sp. JSM 102045 TaxID=1562101 RepID=UPI0035C25E2E
MTNLTSSMRLKVKRDTFFLPDSNSSVYFRNNLSSFRMEGSMVDKWVEKLVPMLNGEHTLGYLTDELPTPYKDRVYEIAEVLYQNGFVRDASQDRPHQLPDQIVKKYASQIEFLDSFGDSGAYRFQNYRQEKVLAVGAGPFVISLVSALLESGLPKFHVLLTGQEPTNKHRLKELIEHARKTDPEVKIDEVNLQKESISWREILQPYETVMYVSQASDIEELRVLHEVCRKEKKTLLPAVCLQQVGLAGPLVHPESEGCWESAWRRLHQSVIYKDDEEIAAFSSTASAMMANLIVFELFKKVTGVIEPEQKNQFFLLNLNTLEGNWHPFIPHPMVTGRVEAKWLQNFDIREHNSRKEDSDGLLICFSQLTSKESGIFHIWEEGDLKQLPLAQCRVQAVNPLSEGPAELLPQIVCTGLTHKEARREAGLTGIEEYVSQTIGQIVTTPSPHQEMTDSMIKPKEFVGIGAGETIMEGVCRGLKSCLAEELRKQIDQKNFVSPVELSAVEDEQCRFYLQTLTTMEGAPLIGLGKEVSGFPVVWVGTNGIWYGSAGLTRTLALRKALQRPLMKAQNQEDCLTTQVFEVSSVTLEETMPQSIVIMEETTQTEVLQSAIQVLERNQKRLSVFELELEPILKEELAGVFGVLLREEETR